jgi:hypothetical protein
MLTGYIPPYRGLECPDRSPYKQAVERHTHGELDIRMR